MQRSYRSRGIALAYTVVGIIVLVLFASLGVDYGRLQMVKGELRHASLAAARAAASSITSPTTAQNLAVQYAALNTADGSPVALNAAQDVEFGTWNGGTRTFTALSGASVINANAVRVTARRTAARQSAVPLFFSSLLGMNTCDVSAVATVAVSPNFGVVGLDYIKLGGNAVYTYWEESGVYNSSGGSVASNGDITLGGNSAINGNAYVGPGKTVDASHVTGTVGTLFQPLVYPNGSAGAYATTNDNGLCPPGTWNSGNNNFSLGSHDNVTLPGGHYYFNNLKTNGNPTLTFSGPATVYVYGDVEINGNANTFASSPGNLNIIMVPKPNGSPPGDFKLTSGSAFYGNIYAPQSAAQLAGSGDIYGSMLFKSVDSTGSSEIHYDLNLPSIGGMALVQ